MAVELFRAADCLDYIGSDPQLPALRVRVKELLLGKERAFTTPIDTGYPGYLLVPRDVYAELGTMELPREEFGVYSTMAGSVILRRAEVRLCMADEKLNTFIETPLHGMGTMLVGRRILSELDLALLGRRKACCHLRASRR